MTPARALHLGKSIKTASRAQRLFSTSLQRDATWGFIGLGRMGMFMRLSDRFCVTIVKFLNT